MKTAELTLRHTWYPFSHPQGFLSLAHAPSDNVIHIRREPMGFLDSTSFAICGNSDEWQIDLKWPRWPVEGTMCDTCVKSHLHMREALAGA